MKSQDDRAIILPNCTGHCFTCWCPWQRYHMTLIRLILTYSSHHLHAITAAQPRYHKSMCTWCATNMVRTYHTYDQVRTTGRHSLEHAAWTRSMLLVDWLYRRNIPGAAAAAAAVVLLLIVSYRTSIRVRLCCCIASHRPAWYIRVMYYLVHSSSSTRARQ